MNANPKVLFAAAEVAPIVSVGGLAEVARLLPKAMRQAGADVRLVIPFYAPLLSQLQPQKLFSVPVQIGDEQSQATIWKSNVDDTPIYMVAGDGRFSDVQQPKRDVYRNRSVLDYCFFGQAVARMLTDLEQRENWGPEIVHANDYHTAFIAIYLKTWGKETPRSILTIHNLPFQGDITSDELADAQLASDENETKWFEFYGKLNPLKAAIERSHLVTTVSPTYAIEIMTTDYGARLENILKSKSSGGRLRGILNGIDPESLEREARAGKPSFMRDAKFLPTTKAMLKKELQIQLELAVNPERPLVAIMGRWGWQKGWHIFEKALTNGYFSDFQVLIETWAIGGQDQQLLNGLREYQRANPRAVAFVTGKDRDLLRFAGPDFVLLPSLYEPCGLIQMESMYFGTVPIVASTGGLADTVVDGETGVTFNAAIDVTDAEGQTDALLHSVKRLGIAMRRAGALFQNEQRFRSIQLSAYGVDNSWAGRVAAYQKLYEDALTS